MTTPWPIIVLWALTSTSATAQDTPYALTERGAHHRVWQRTVFEIAPDGRQIPHLHQYTELATGLHYQKDGQWVESKEEIEPFATGAIARQGQYQVIFANNLNTTGAIDHQTPDGKRLLSNILGLGYYDNSTGNSVLIAQLQDSEGELVASNQVLYPNAFEGVKADVRYTYRKGSFEQDVILLEQPQTPEVYGLNSDTTELEVITEFINPPSATVETCKANGNIPSDVTISWGVTRIGLGQAFDLGDARNPRSRVPVRKQYVAEQGRTFLLERVPVKSIQSPLASLPSQAREKSKLPNLVSKRPLLPKARLARLSQKPMRLALTSSPGKGYVLDYETFNPAASNNIFQGDYTYYISGEYNLIGTTTIEGNSVIKFGSDGLIHIDQSGSINCKTGPYRPAIFTSKSDNSVGATIDGSNGDPHAWDVYTLLNINCTNAVLRYLRFKHCWMPVTDYGSSYINNLDIWNCQFVDVGEMVFAYNCNVGVHNVLMSATVDSPPDPVIFITGSGNLVAEHVTVGNYPFQLQIDDPEATVCLTNCLAIQGTTVTPIITQNSQGSTNCQNSPVKAVGAGCYYLADDSPFRNCGTTNINPALQAELRQKTTYPPVVYSNRTISANTTFSPQVQRDTDTPDLGYHYDPLDYAICGNFVTNATVTVNPGTAIAVFRTNDHAYGFGLGLGAQLICQGSATNLNRIVDYNTVQEQGTNTGWRVPYYALVTDAFPASTQRVVNCSFTDWSVLAQDAPHVICNDSQPLNFQNCQFHGGKLSLNVAFTLTNCLLERVYGELYPFDENIPVIRNSLFYGGTFDLCPGVTNVVVKDNLFDRATIVQDLTGWGYDGGNNAFVTNYDRMLPTFSSDVILSNSPAYQIGPLGNYYLPTNSPLINTGSVTAAVIGLYHFTTQTNQVKETNSVADIGYHYVAVDADINPIDTNSDGIPDYIEDSNGNGLVDSGEVGWNIYGDLGLKVLITRPRNGSNLP